jgi:hypothetical protein
LPNGRWSSRTKNPKRRSKITFKLFAVAAYMYVSGLMMIEVYQTVIHGLTLLMFPVYVYVSRLNTACDLKVHVLFEYKLHS